MGEKWDVVVAGAGAAGLAAARAAAAEGAKVLLLEMQAQVGGRSQSATLVPSDFADSLPKAAVFGVREIWLHAPHGSLRARLAGGIVDELHLTKLLAAEAADSGADIWLNAPVKRFLEMDGTIRGVHIEAGSWSENIEGEVVIDATGARGDFSSLFLRDVLKGSWNRELLAFNNEYLMANHGAGGAAEIFFDSYSVPGGHAWVYPLERGFSVAGVQGLRIHPDAALDEFLGRRQIKSLARALPVAASRGQVPLEGPLPRTCADGIIAVGGAAGQIYPPSGQGLRYSLRAGAIAGRVAVDAVTDGDVSRERLAEYERAWKSEFGRDFEVGSLIRSSLGISQDRKMDAIMLTLKGKARLQRAFLGVFNGFELESSVTTLLKSNEMARILGREMADRLG